MKPLHPLCATLCALGVEASAAPDFTVRMGAFPADETPAFTHGAVVEVSVSNAGARAVSGASLRVTRWDGTPVAPVRCLSDDAALPPAPPGPPSSEGAEWKEGETRRFSLSTAGLEPDGYVLTVVAEDGAALSEPRTFGVFAPFEPRELFGVGNGMVCEYRPGHVLCGASNAFEARDLKPVAIGKADAFEAAVARAPQSVECGVGGPSPSGEPDANTPDGRHLNVYSPAGRAELLRAARAFGERAARNPQWATAKLRNEMFHLFRGDLLPDRWADADFRRFLRARYGGDLARLNAAWGTELARWEDAAQPISAASGSAGAPPADGGGADWLAAMGRFTDESKAAIRRNPAQAMDWFRWRAASVNEVYAAYVAEAKKAGPGSKILYGNNYPWPNYFAHVVWPQWRAHDVAMLDLQYVCGFEKTLGGDEEMLDILEAAESVASRAGRPVWGREVYVQPRYPGEMAALQNWAMVAHGMDVALVFAWKPFADRDRGIFKTGPRSWERPESPPMWFLIDVDGTRLPAYAAVKRSAAEIAAFDERVDARKLRRIPGQTALYWSTETSVKIMYDTFDRPYQSAFAKARPAITAALRLRGVRVDFLDDATLGELSPERFPVCVVPPAPVVSDAALAALRAYAAAGGRLVLFEPFDTLDVNLRPKKAAGDGGLPNAVRVPEFPGRFDPLPHEPDAFDGLVERAGVPRSAWWENGAAGCRTPGSGPGKGPPTVEVAVRRHAGTGRRYAFVLNRGGAGTGRLRGPDFEGATLRDALTGEPVSRELALPAFGYRILEIGDTP